MYKLLDLACVRRKMRRAIETPIHKTTATIKVMNHHLNIPSLLSLLTQNKTNIKMLLQACYHNRNVIHHYG